MFLSQEVQRCYLLSRFIKSLQSDETQRKSKANRLISWQETLNSNIFFLCLTETCFAHFNFIKHTFLIVVLHIYTWINCVRGGSTSACSLGFSRASVSTLLLPPAAKLNEKMCCEAEDSGKKMVLLVQLKFFKH